MFVAGKTSIDGKTVLCLFNAEIGYKFQNDL